MPEMPERVYLSGFDSYQGWSLAPCDDCPAYVPESRLREVEAARDDALEKLAYTKKDIDVLIEKCTALRAERDALVPLARDWLGNDGLTLLPHNITREQVQAARAILDRREKEGA